MEILNLTEIEDAAYHKAEMYDDDFRRKTQKLIKEEIKDNDQPN